MNHEQKIAMLDAARAARNNAWAPYSGFAVGAAVLGGTGRIYAGCNVENASYPVGSCAERNAIGAAVAAGETSIAAVLVTSIDEKPVPPCGMCRQALAEFGIEMTVITVGKYGAEKTFTLDQLLPEAFGSGFLANLQKDT
jgi:cytidine deaminase